MLGSDWYCNWHARALSVAQLAWDQSVSVNGSVVERQNLTVVVMQGA